MKTVERKMTREDRVLLFLIVYKWLSLSIALVLLSIQRPAPWWIVIGAAAYTALITIYFRYKAAGRYPETPLVFLDLVICVCLIIAGGRLSTGSELNPFFLHSFTPLLTIAIMHEFRDSFLTAFILSLSYFYASIGEPGWSLVETEFLDTHIANSLSYYVVAVMMAWATGSLRRRHMDEPAFNPGEWAADQATYIDTGMLSPVEAEVFRLMQDGASDEEIAEQIFITESAVGSHITSIFKKLGTKSRVEPAGSKAEG